MKEKAEYLVSRCPSAEFPFGFKYIWFGNLEEAERVQPQQATVKRMEEKKPSSSRWALELPVSGYSDRDERN